MMPAGGARARRIVRQSKIDKEASARVRATITVPRETSHGYCASIPHVREFARAEGLTAYVY